MMLEVDFDGNGSIEFPEFVILLTTKIQAMGKKVEMQTCFDLIDREKDDYITAKELKYWMRKVALMKLSSEEADYMLEYAGATNGKLNFEQFTQLMNVVKGNFRAVLDDNHGEPVKQQRK